jgi:hypothetical protein
MTMTSAIKKLKMKWLFVSLGVLLVASAGAVKYRQQRADKCDIIYVDQQWFMGRFLYSALNKKLDSFVDYIDRNYCRSFIFYKENYPKYYWDTKEKTWKITHEESYQSMSEYWRAPGTSFFKDVKNLPFYQGILDRRRVGLLRNKWWLVKTGPDWRGFCINRAMTINGKLYPEYKEGSSKPIDGLKEVPYVAGMQMDCTESVGPLPFGSLQDGVMEQDYIRNGSGQFFDNDDYDQSGPFAGQLRYLAHSHRPVSDVNLYTGLTEREYEETLRELRARYTAKLAERTRPLLRDANGKVKILRFADIKIGSRLHKAAPIAYARRNTGAPLLTCRFIATEDQRRLWLDVADCLTAGLTTPEGGRLCELKPTAKANMTNWRDILTCKQGQ